MDQLLVSITIMTRPSLVCIWCLFHQYAKACLILSHTEYLFICWNCPVVRCIVWIIWGRVEKTFEGFGDVICHGNIKIFPVLITVNGQSTVVLPLKVHGYFIIFLKSSQEMIIFSIRKLFDTKNINADTIFALLYASRGLWSIHKGHKHEE